MLLIEAIIKPFKLDDVKEALEELGIGGMTITEVLQATPMKQAGRSFGASPTASGMVPKIIVQVAVPAVLAERIIEALCLHGATGKSEDGRITVKRIERAIRIRTGDMDGEAIS